MKIKYFLLLSIISGVLLTNCADESNTEKSCQCYCSEKCGPRDIDNGDAPEKDKPFTANVDGKDICFCQQRDYENYIPNGCEYKEGELKNNCCGLINEPDEEIISA